MNYSAILDYMFSQLPMFQRIGGAAYKANLNNTIAILNVLDNPQHKFKSLHIAGTNGKGSVSHYLAAIFQSAGYKTGLYTSPHLKDFRERIKINGKMISKQKVSHFISSYKSDFEIIQPSFFEMTAGMAFKYFADENVDIAIVETGMGGRLDSTNLINPELSIITNIGLDHTQFLGETIAEIATEKAGIIKEKIPVVIGETNTESKKVFEKKAKEKKSFISFADKNFVINSFYHINNNKGHFLSVDILNTQNKKELQIISELNGIYQLKNIKTVLTAIDLLKEKGYKIRLGHIKKGIANVIKLTGLLGRWQILNTGPLTICDTGHNEDGIKEVLQQIELTPHDNLHFVLGMVNDKEIDKVLLMLPKEAIYYFCKANIPRGMDENILKEKALSIGLKGEKYSSVKNAIKAAKTKANTTDLIFIGGSTFVVAEV
jgi:dihydrofolate synthase/folylpolyglutamate synthase